MKELIYVQQLINDFEKVKRSIYMPSSNSQPENDVHHSASVAFLAWQIHDDLALNLDMAKILKYALAHDVVEIYAGDVNAFASAKDRAQKKLNEAKSLERIERETAGLFPDLAVIIKGYENRIDDEARFVWSVDKIQPLLQGNADQNRPFYESGITLNQVSEKYASMTADIYPPLRPLWLEASTWFISQYDDDKVNRSGKPLNNSAARS